MSKSWDRIKKKAKLQMIANGDLKMHEDDRPLSELEDMYDDYNHSLFEGALPQDLTVYWNPRLKRAYGKAFYTAKGKGIKRGTRKGCKPERIEMKPGLTPRMTRKTLVHEMCHIWAFQTHGEVGHGPRFWQMMKKCGYRKGHFFENQLERETDRWAE